MEDIKRERADACITVSRQPTEDLVKAQLY